MQCMFPIAVLLNDKGAIDKVRYFHWANEAELSNNLSDVEFQTSVSVGAVGNFVSRVIDFTLETLYSLEGACIQVSRGLAIIDYRGVVKKDILQMMACWSTEASGYMGVFVDWRGKSVVMPLNKMNDLCNKANIELGIVPEDILCKWENVILSKFSGRKYASKEKLREIDEKLSSTDLFNLSYVWENRTGELCLKDVNSREFLVPDMFGVVNINGNSVLQSLCAPNVVALRLVALSSLRELVAPRVMREFVLAGALGGEVKLKLPEEVVPIDNKPAVFTLGYKVSPSEVGLEEIDQSRYILARRSMHIVCPNLKKAVLSIPDHSSEFDACSFLEARSLEYIKFVRIMPYVHKRCDTSVFLSGIRGNLLIDWQADIADALLCLCVELCSDDDLVTIRVRSRIDIAVALDSRVPRKLRSKVLFLFGNNVDIHQTTYSDDTSNHDLYWSYTVSSVEEESDMIHRVNQVVNSAGEQPLYGFIIKERF